MASTGLPARTYGEMAAIAKKASWGGQDERPKRLDDEARRVEQRAAGPPVIDVIVFSWEPAPEARRSFSETKPKPACCSR